MECNAAEKLVKSYEDLISQAHAIMSAGGVPDATGRPCDDKNCQSKLIHRINELLRERDGLKEDAWKYRELSK